MAKGFIIAGERSGVGKTTLTLALVMACLKRGLNVQCFKVGPDFIDPGYHAAISGRLSRNLDGWMMGRECCVESFLINSGDTDLAVVEGVMGVFDGYDGTSEDGSTAQIAKWLGLPVLLVVDGSSFARTAGALVLGFEQYDPEVHIAGVIFNRVAEENHYRYLSDGVKSRCSAEVMGYVPRNSQWLIEERHLGLVMAGEIEGLQEKVAGLSAVIEKTVDIDAIVRLARASSEHAGEHLSPAHNSGGRTIKIGVARDEAFCFYYQDNLDYFMRWGAEVVYFSPIHDAALPCGINGLYLGGGYPELHAQALSKNKAMRDAVLNFCVSRNPVYAECGGFLYLLESLTDLGGSRYKMAGLFPAEALMRSHLQRLGYVEVVVQDECPFLNEGGKIRGHEFHYSDITEMPSYIRRCYKVMKKKGRQAVSEGYMLHNVVASYIHLHFASYPGFAQGFVDACMRQAAESRPA